MTSHREAMRFVIRFAKIQHNIKFIYLEIIDSRKTIDIGISWSYWTRHTNSNRWNLRVIRQQTVVIIIDGEAGSISS